MNKLLPLVLVSMVAALAGCSFDAKYRGMSLQAPARDVRLEYRCQPGDRLSVTFMRSLSDSISEDYRLQAGDEVQLSVQDRDDLGRVSTVAPDGKIYFPYLAPLPAGGKTLKELQTLAEEKYQPMVQTARVTLVPLHFAGKLDAVLQGLGSVGKQGPEYSATIGLDGKAVFPQLGYLRAEGFTPQEFNAELRQAYFKILPGVEVTVNITPGSSRFVTVLGELKRPGSFPVEGTVSLTAALGMAEGWLPSAHLQDIILVQRREKQVIISKVDLEKDLMTATEIRLVGGDLVFLPRSAITDLNLFVDQYLRKNLPFAVGVSVPATSLSLP